MSQRLPTLFIPHGGGPCFFMDPPPQAPHLWDQMAAYLRGLADAVGQRPKALLIISGHWETERPTVNVGARPGMLFDYYGFPEHTYRLNYPAPGAPELGLQVQGLLAEAGFETDLDAERGYDHGVFVPMMLSYPDADVPVLQLSLQQDLDPAQHLAIGRALEPLRDEGVLIIGSGMSFHNLRTLRGPTGDAGSEAFDAWLTAAATAPDPAVRDAQLAAWSQAPFAREAHPREEHLLPLMVAAGAAGTDRGRRTYSDHLGGKALSGFQFG
ncbi:class III extradiol ring-cleavage dioxygenase [Phenylobacterium aquaticum]|uniref:DODA-type extradiol aromatic ring-opening family dioxygenase n=2 Tax=Phenylobacterium aquaticum TaxID=1763816 RepID=UPI0026EF373C|nr:class III extradiol ring-cleavage dioxygenase [Phenylobacterium aquaticum]